MNLAPSGFASDNEMDNEDKINAMMEVRKLLPNASYYRLIKTVQDALMFDKKRAQKKRRSFVESDSYTIAQKADMKVAYFHEWIVSKGKID